MKLDVHPDDAAQRVYAPAAGPRPTLRAGRSKGLGLAGWLAVAFLPAAIGAAFPPGAWYAALAKPWWTPPGAVFGPVWFALYAAMGVAAWQVWLRRGWSAPLVPFAVQLALNAAWTPLFFGAHALAASFALILVLFAAIAVTAVVFWRVSALAGGLLLPYLGWVGFAAALNGAIWRLNAGG